MIEYILLAFFKVTYFQFKHAASLKMAPDILRNSMAHYDML